MCGSRPRLPRLSPGGAADHEPWPLPSQTLRHRPAPAPAPPADSKLQSVFESCLRLPFFRAALLSRPDADAATADDAVCMFQLAKETMAARQPMSPASKKEDA